MSDCKEITHIQEQRNPNKGVGIGTTVRRFLTSKSREAPGRWWRLEWRLEALVQLLHGAGETLRRYPMSRGKGDTPARL